MNNPGIFDLGDRVITNALTSEVITEVGDVEYVSDLEGMLACNVTIRFAYGSGGTDCKVYVQTSLNQGQTWCDVVCGAFTTNSQEMIFNLSGLTPISTLYEPTDGNLNDNSIKDGILGDRWRCKVTSTGTYSSSTSLSVRLVAR